MVLYHQTIQYKAVVDFIKETFYDNDDILLQKRKKIDRSRA